MNFKLSQFEGPLDLLLFLLQKNQMSIYDIEITEITKQYMQYLDNAVQVELEQMSEFIVMAATLILIKSRTLLPKVEQEETEEEDPREELVQRLLEYKKFKYVSEQLDEMQNQSLIYCFRNYEIASDIEQPKPVVNEVLGGTTLGGLYETFQQLIKQQQMLAKRREKPLDSEILKKDVYSVAQKSSYILDLLKLENEVTFYSLCYIDMPKVEFIVTFMSLLELIHKRMVFIEQSKYFTDIIIRIL